MANCSLKSKQLGVLFTAGIKLGSGLGNVETEALVRTMVSKLDRNQFDPLVMAHVIQGSMKVSKGAIMEMIKLTDIAEILKFIEANSADAASIEENLRKLSMVKGFSTFEESVKTLEAVAHINLVAVPGQLDTYTTETTSVQTHGIMIDPELQAADVLVIDNAGTEMLKRKASRIEKTKNIKETASDFWIPFLSTYFPGMSGVGADFINWTKDLFYDALIDKTEAQEGFLYNVNEGINKIKTLVENEVLSRKNTHPYMFNELNSSVLNGSDLIKTKYFHEVLATDFDFILNNMIKSIVVSSKETKATNEVVSGFVGDNGAPISSRVLRIPQAIKKDFFKKGEKNNFSLKGITDGGFPVPNILSTVELDTVSFAANAELPNNAFYFTSIDEKYFYRNSRGENLDMTAKAFYSYNSASKRNQNSIDHFIGALDSDSTFIQSLFQMFRRVETTDNGLAYGERMTVIDFLTLAPFLVNAGKDLETFVGNLKKKAAEESEAGRIAKSLMVHVFNDDYTQLGNGERVYSIYQATQKSSLSRPTINHQIVKTLHNALINKDNVRYLKVEEDITSITKDINNSTETDTVNTELAGMLMSDSFTKRGIAQALKVSKGGKSFTVDLFGRTMDYNDINTIEKCNEVAKALGLHRQFNAIHSKFITSYLLSKANKATVDVFKNILYVAAVNMKEGALKPTEPDSKIFEHPNYMVMSPTTVISGDSLKVLASLYNVDSHKATSVGGNLTASTSTPNRDSSISEQVTTYDDYNKRVNAVKFSFNPFLESVSSLIPKAQFQGIVLKTPIVKNGIAIKLSDWDVRVRIEHAMVQGFLQAPKNLGREFYMQPINYSDKSNIEMPKMSIPDVNLLAPGEETKQLLIDAYIEYQALKNEELQKVTIHNLKGYVVGNYDRLYNKLSSEPGADQRLPALEQLRLALLRDYNSMQGDMTRGLNDILKVVALSSEDIKYSDSSLDAGADYVSFDGNAGAAILKPHLGIRAEMYRNPKLAKAEVDKALYDNRVSLEEMKVNSDRIQKEIDKVSKRDKTADIVDSSEEFYDRFYLIHGIYGHALKTLTMGDESYFSSKYKKGESIDDYYNAVDSGKRNGLEESENMLKSQFKRAQSELTRGSVYSQKTTIEGFKRKHGKQNVLHYLDIYGSNVAGVGPLGERTMVGSEFRYDELKGRTLKELEGMGVISRFSDGQLVNKNALGTLVKFNVGKDRIVVGNYIDAVPELKKSVNAQLVDSLYEITKEAISNTSVSASEASVSVLNVPITNMTHGVTRDVPGREYEMTLDAYIDEIDKIKNNYFLVMPDLIPSMTVSDPVSYINLLNSMGHTQENSDGVQFMHPLMSLIMEEARGGALGAFNTENQEALKLLTTTFEYDKMRQILQKKSVQMPFTTEQMKKLGSMELYNTFKKMNSAIEFKQTVMTIKRNNRPVTVEVKNLQQLYEMVVADLKGYGASDAAIWAEVLERLRQNPLNMFSFVGLLTLPSNQKTGHKKLNKYSDVFSQKENAQKPNIDYTANEYNYEVLTKAHDYDVSGVLRSSSTLTLLSQLVNAVSFGGLSDLSAKNLQNAMGGRMMLNRLRAGKDLAQVAKILKAEEGIGTKYNRVIDRLEEGNVSTKGLTSDEMGAYDRVLRAGVYEMANLAFQKNDSMLIYKIIKGLKITVDADGKEIPMENAYSLDTPAVRSKVMGTLRASFFQETVKMKMAGFMGTVSASHKTINIFTLPNGKRVGRQGFVKGALLAGLPEGSEGAVIDITESNFAYAKANIIPFDEVMVTKKRRSDGSPLEKTTRPFGDITIDDLLDPYTEIKGVITPDMLYSPQVSAENFQQLDENTLIKVTAKGKSKVFFKWYLSEIYSQDELYGLIQAGGLEEEITEKYSLRWYDYTKDSGTYNLKSTDAYRQYYRAAMNSDTEEERMDEVRALLILETQSKKEDGTAVWQASTPEVVLPTYMAAAFGLERGGSIHDVVGTDGNDLYNATQYFRKSPSVAARFILLTSNEVNYTDEVKRIYSRKLVFENNTFDESVLQYLNENENQETISPEGVKAINVIIAKHRDAQAIAMGETFMDSLEAALTRVPGQGKQSAFMGRVIELLDSQGNATFAPTEHLVTTGGDLDIDTLSVYTKSIDAHGRMHRPAASMMDNNNVFSINNTLEKYKYDLEASEERVRDLSAKSNQETAKFIQVREENLAKQSTDKGIADATEKLRRAKNLIIPEEKIEEIVGLNRKKVHALYENIVSNVMAEAVFRSLDNVDTSVELNTPISMSMFGELIERIEKHNEGIKAVNTTVSVDRTMPWAELNALQVYSSKGVNSVRTANREADFKHFGNPFTGSFAPGLIAVGEHRLSREEIMYPENSDKLTDNAKLAVVLYNEWLTSDRAVASYTDVDGNEIQLSAVAPEQKAWIRDQINKGKLDGKTLLYMAEGGAALEDKLTSHATALANIVGTRNSRQRSGEDFKAIFEYENLAAQGKEAIGIFATVLKINSAIQTAKINYDTNYASADRVSYDNPFFFNNSIEYVDFTTNEKEERSRSGFADLDRFNISQSVSKSTDLQKTIANLVNKDKKYNKNSVIMLVNILEGQIKAHLDMSTFGPTSTEAVSLMASLSKSLFNIKLPSAVMESDSPMAAFTAYLKENTKLVARAYTAVIGKQLSNDVQSQFLSAATDNAKELILGKIKSNQLTNPVMTGMMLLGYDTKTIIDFLYDPHVSDVFDHYSDKISNLERASITEKDLQAAGIDTNTASVQSLLSLLKIGEEVSKFRSVRSLNENAQIEQYKLDRILEDLDSDNLYEAIMSNDITRIKSKNTAQETFNPNMMVFLHPQSRHLFINLYESEVFKVPSLFKVTNEVSEIAGKTSRNMSSYKNIFSYISEVQVEGFFNQSKETQGKDGKVKHVFRTGNLVEISEGGEPVRTIVPLNQPANRAAFVKNFESYLEDVKDQLLRLGGIENAALAQLGRGKSYKSTNTIFYFPKIKNANSDSLEVSLIQEGINELKIKTGNKEIDALHSELHNNLSNYAMIVSSGEIKKGSMIEMFEEINLELAEYLNSMTSRDYKKIRPEVEIIATLIKGEVLFEDAVISRNKAESLANMDPDTAELYSEAQSQAAQGEVENDGDYGQDDSMLAQQEQADNFEMGGVKFVKAKQSEAVRAVYSGKKWTVNNVFKVMDPDLRNDIFYAYKAGEIAYRLFPSEAKEALPTTTLPSNIDFTKIPKNVVSELALTGYQIGFSAMYQGEPVRILAYKGHAAGYEEYIVAHATGTQLIPGVHLMADNPSLLLSGNIIQELRSSNRVTMLLKQEYNKTIIARVANYMTPVDNAVTVFSSYVFSDDDIQRDPIISRESRVLGIPGKAYDVIKLKNSAISNATKSFVAYNTSDRFIKANKGSVRTLIPSLYVAIKGGVLADSDIVDEMMYQVTEILNGVKVGEEVVFYGLGSNTNFRQNGPHVLAGGRDILNNFFKQFKSRKTTAGTTVLEGSLEITEEFEDSTNMYKITINKKKANLGLVVIGGTAVAVHTEKNKDSRIVSSKDWVNDQVKNKAIEMKIVNPPHKLMVAGIGGVKEDLVVLKTAEGSYEIFIKRLDRGHNDKYIKIRSTSNKDGIFDSVNNTYDMPSAKYDVLVDIIKQDGTKPINHTC